MKDFVISVEAFLIGLLLGMLLIFYYDKPTPPKLDLNGLFNPPILFPVDPPNNDSPLIQPKAEKESPHST